MAVNGWTSSLVVLLSVALTSCYEGAGLAKPSKPPLLFLTMKSSNFGMAQLDHIKSGFLLVTDILISPDGVPLPFCNDNCVYKKRADLKVIASFGGSVVPSDLFVFLSCDDNRRETFVNNLVEFILAHGFDGIDLSWLYPALQERDRYVRLLKELRNACDRNGLLLTVTVPSRPSVIEVNYPAEKLEKYADYVILSTTEFRKLRKTSFIAPLYPSSPGSSNNIDYHIDRWKQAGLSCGKIVIVIQTMTLTYKLYIHNEYRIGTPALQLKIRPYYKICRKLYSGSLEIWDNSAKSPYAFRDLSWYSYENEKSIKEKVGYVVQQRLAGIAVFYYDEDDPINICGDGQYPLTTIVLAAMQAEYLPPSVITDSQIYHFEAPSMVYPFSHVRKTDSHTASQHRKPYDFYVENTSDSHGQLMAGMPMGLEKSFPVSSDLNRQMSLPSDLYKGSQVSSDGRQMSVLEALLPKTPSPTASLEMLFDGMTSYEQIEHEDEFLFYPLPDQVTIDESVGTLPFAIRPPSVLTGSAGSSVTSVQLFSENSQSDDHTQTSSLFLKKSPLFSEQADIQSVVFTEPCCLKDRHQRPRTHIPPVSHVVHQHQPCPPKLPGIRIFATAHGPKSTTTTTTTTPNPMQFYTMSPATYQPPTFCQSCKSCVKLSATSGADGPSACTLPLSHPNNPSPCHSVQLFSEQGEAVAVSDAQLLTHPARAPAGLSVRLQANSVGAQPITTFVPLEMTVCPCDGILRDPHDKRSYYLCKRGLSMCDENKFTCAHGYIFDATSKKCIAERS